MLSVTSVQGMRSRLSSQAVSRAPCRNGRVSQAIDGDAFADLPRAADHAERGAVARGRERARVAVREHGALVGEQGGAVRPSARLTAMSSSWIARASRSSRLAQPSERFAPRARGRRDACARSAQDRFTAVGRVPRRASGRCARSPRAKRRSGRRRAPSAAPIAAATPIAGAPRITMSRIALRDLAESSVDAVDFALGQQALIEHHHAPAAPLDGANHRRHAASRRRVRAKPVMQSRVDCCGMKPSSDRARSPSATHGYCR